MIDIQVVRGEPTEAANVLRFIHKTHERHNQSQVEIIDRYALPWVTDVVCFGICFNAVRNGRIVGSHGLSVQKVRWNHYVSYMETEWLHVLDNFADTRVRDNLIIAARDECQAQGRDMRLSIPEYLWREGDATAEIIGSQYFFKSGGRHDGTEVRDTQS